MSLTASATSSAQTASIAERVFDCRAVSVKLAHQLGARNVLDNVSFEVRRGEFFTIVGPSGTGKTTLLRVLAGLTPCATGSVQMHGRDLSGPPEDAVMIFQDYSHALLQWRTVARNVGFGIEGRVDAAELSIAYKMRWRWLGWKRTPTIIRGNSRAACNSGFRSPARWRCGHPCC